ncbi:MAG: inorganic diphosphatase [Chloroflexi bacterium]|nr:inorganic diphosphatase [Chloroflexota bacterium]
MDANLHLSDWIGRMVEIVIDRPLGTAHPRYPDMVYPINYGYLPGTLAPDGHPLDVYVLGYDQPLERCSAQVIAMIRRKDDVEDKIVVALSGRWDDASIMKAVAFQEGYFNSYVELP